VSHLLVVVSSISVLSCKSQSSLVLRTSDSRNVGRQYLLISRLLPDKGFYNARDGAIAFIFLTAVSSNLHMICVNALNSLQRSWEVELRREVVHHLEVFSVL
jgi:hypothetical protein